MPGTQAIPLVAVRMSEGAEHCCATLEEFGVPYSTAITSSSKVIIATGDLAGQLAAETVLPVLAVPMGGLDALRAASELPVATLAIGKPGAINAALLAIAIMAADDDALRAKLLTYRQKQTADVLAAEL